MNIQPFTITVAQSTLDDLRERLARTRWPDEVQGAGWDYGTNLDYLKALVAYWQNQFDWRAQEARLNQFAQFRAEIDGFGIHFIHERGQGPKPLPIIHYPWLAWLVLRDAQDYPFADRSSGPWRRSSGLVRRDRSIPAGVRILRPSQRWRHDDDENRRAVGALDDGSARSIFALLLLAETSVPESRSAWLWRILICSLASILPTSDLPPRALNSPICRKRSSAICMLSAVVTARGCLFKDPIDKAANAGLWLERLPGWSGSVDY